MVDIESLRRSAERLIATQECAILSDDQYSDVQSLRKTLIQFCDQGKRDEAHAVFTEIRDIISAGPAIPE